MHKIYHTAAVCMNIPRAYIYNAYTHTRKLLPRWVLQSAVPLIALFFRDAEDRVSLRKEQGRENRDGCCEKCEKPEQVARRALAHRHAVIVQ